MQQKSVLVNSIFVVMFGAASVLISCSKGSSSSSSAGGVQDEEEEDTDTSCDDRPCPKIKSKAAAKAPTDAAAESEAGDSPENQPDGSGNAASAGGAADKAAADKTPADKAAADKAAADKKGTPPAAPTGDPKVIRWVRKAWAPTKNEKDAAAEPRYVMPTSYNYVSSILNGLEGNYETKIGGNTDNVFHCPGGSVLAGMLALHNLEANDRQYAERCMFFEDGQGRPLSKGSCTVHQAQIDDDEVHRAAGYTENAVARCPPGKVFAGHKSIFDGNTRDRLHSYECCELKTAEQKKVVYKLAAAPVDGEDPQYDCEAKKGTRSARLSIEANSSVNPSLELINFACELDKVLKEVSLSFTATEARLGDHSVDRIFSFKCCSLGLEGEIPAPPAPAKKP